ncbi:MAG: DNA repair protein RadC, partial [Bacteroidetes bacterium]|nr:DNA repair protein RadC [Bacteroidota bacterium]
MPEQPDAHNQSIKQWAEDDRPREKLLLKGPAALSDAELLAILIHSGTKKNSALALAQKVLKKANNDLNELGRLSVRDLQLPGQGLGEARAISIAAALELGRRRQRAEGMNRASIHSKEQAAEILISLLADRNTEAFCVLYLNQANRLLRSEIISEGGMAGTVVDLRVILKNALLQGANQLIVAHNHPSGNLRPSEADIKLTHKLRESAALMDIRLLDHIIVGGQQ